MRRLLCWVVLLVVLIGLLPTVSAQDDGIVLESFIDETYGLQGVIPQEWESLGSGLYARDIGGGDITLVAVQSAPSSADDVWTALLPQFGLAEIPESDGTYAGQSFNFTLYQFESSMSGTTDQFDLGMTEQSGQTILVLLTANADEYDILHEQVFLPMLDALAPLENDEDLPYAVEEVTFTNGDFTLAGTLTIPTGEGQHPAVVLMTGSGPQNRDEMVVPGFPIFRLLADYLTREDIAVLRYDDRGVGASDGEWAETSLHDFAADAQAAVDYLATRADINSEQIGLLGHSEGGMYAAIMGANPDSNVAFVILMAGPAIGGTDILIEQNKDIFTQAGASPEELQAQIDLLQNIFPLLASRDYDAVYDVVYETALAQWEAATPLEQTLSGFEDGAEFAQSSAETMMAQVANEPFASLMEYDPTTDLLATEIPILAIFGRLDIQVNAEVNVAAFEAILAESGNPDATIITLEDANHLFQAAQTGSLDEYSTLEPNFTPDFLPTVSNWILARVDVSAE